MGFDYRELATKVLIAQGKKDDDDQGEDGTVTRCQCCETTQDVDPKCKQCNTTQPHDDEPGRRYAQDLTDLRQQLRDALAAG